MEETETAVVSLFPQVPSANSSLAELMAPLEKQVMASMDDLVVHLQSLHQQDHLDKETLKDGIHQVSRFAQASLLIRTLPLLLNPPNAKDSLQTAELFKKVHQTAETLKGLCRDQTMQEIDRKTAQILEQIQAKEQQIREQISQKQQAIAQLVRSQTQAG